MKIKMVACAMLLALVACTSSGSDVAPTPSGPRIRLSPGQLVWHTLTDMPRAVQDAGVAVVGTKIWVIGGLTARGVTNEVEIYDTAADKWSAGPALPAPVAKPAVAAEGGAVWVFGGEDARGKPTATVFGSNNGTAWTAKRLLPKAQVPDGAIVLGDLVYVIGSDDTESARTVPSYGPAGGVDLGAFKRRAPMPTPRPDAAVSTDAAGIFVTGGLAGGKAVSTTEKYNPAVDQWTRLSDMPDARGDHAAVFYDGKIVAVGGEDTTDPGFPPVAATNEMDPVKGTWTRSLPPMFRARHGAAVAVVGGVLYVLGGGSQSGLRPTSVCDKLVASS